MKAKLELDESSNNALVCANTPPFQAKILAIAECRGEYQKILEETDDILLLRNFRSVVYNTYSGVHNCLCQTEEVGNAEKVNASLAALKAVSSFVIKSRLVRECILSS